MLCDLCDHEFCGDCDTWCCKCGDGKVPAATKPHLTETVPPRALIQLLEAALLHPESAEGYIRQVIGVLSATARADGGEDGSMTGTTTPQLTEREVAEIEARANAASEGPWQAYYRVSPRGAHKHWHIGNSEGLCQITMAGHERDYQFMAHARVDIPALIRDWRALKASDQHNYDLWLALKERHAHRFADESGKWADTCRQCGVTTGDDHDGYDCIAWLQRQNAALREQLAQAEKEREQKLIDVLDSFRSRNIRRIDLIEALLKEELIHADERHGQLTTNE